MQAAHYRPHRNVHDLGDLLVREPLDVGQQHRHAELLGQRLERLLHDLVGHALEHLGLGRAPDLRGLDATEPPIERELLDVVELGLLGPALLGPVDVDERVGEDLVEPRLEVRAVLEPAEAPVRAEVRLLDEILGVSRVSGHPERGRVQRVHVGHRELGEARLVGHRFERTPRL